MTDVPRTTPSDATWRGGVAAPFPLNQPGTPMAWGEYSADQADGFAPTYDDPLTPDLDDDPGYGFGV